MLRLAISGRRPNPIPPFLTALLLLAAPAPDAVAQPVGGSDDTAESRRPPPPPPPPPLDEGADEAGGDDAPGAPAAAEEEPPASRRPRHVRSDAPPPEGSRRGQGRRPLRPAPDVKLIAVPPPKPNFWEDVLDSFEFHGYTRMPLSFYAGDASEEQGGGTEGPRAPNLVDDDYYLSGFAYTRLHETDWAQVFLSAKSHEVTLTVGLYASLFSTWAQYQTDEQWGIAQASLTWEHRFESPYFKRLAVQAGVFWNDFGFIQPYDTYLFGRTHQGGIRVEAEFPWVELQFGFGAHLSLPQQNSGFTPLLYGSVKLKPPRLPFNAGFYVLHQWGKDIPPLTKREDAKMTTLGFEVNAEIPYIKGPLRIIPWAYYSLENAEYLPKTIEVLHAVDGKRMMSHYLGQDSDHGDGSFPYVGAIDLPARLWGGSEGLPVFTGPLWVRLFGMVAYVKSPQESNEPSKNFNNRTYLKWGIEPEYGVFPWLRFSVRYDRVILDMYDGENSFHAVSPRLSFKVFRDGEIFMLFTKYFYGDKVSLRTGQVLGGITIPDADVFKIQAQASW